MSKKTINKCPNGHVMDPNWDSCPYCDAQKKSRQEVDATRKPTIDLTYTDDNAEPHVRRTLVDGISSVSQSRRTIVLPQDGVDAPASGKQVNDYRKIVGVLVSYSWIPSGQIYPIREGKNYITSGNGDSMPSDQTYNIQVPQDQRMSRVHALILYRAGKYEIIDQESSNGTFINGEILPSNLSVELNNNDEIKTGSTLWTFIKINSHTE